MSATAAKPNTDSQNAYADQSAPYRVGADHRLNQATERVRELNERVLDGSRTTGLAFLDTYERSLKGVADFQDEVAKATQVEWVSAIGHSQAQITREVAESTTSAARGLFARR